jgi:2-oxoglutarate dehydrogenase E2 component (dihydrolipoamide succinyltransferase)
MHIEVLVPNLPESVSDATLVNWHKVPGDHVNKGDNLVDLETDKVILEVPAPESGLLSSILKPNDTVVVAGEVLAHIEPGNNQVPAAAASPATDSASSPLSPAVRRILNEHQLDPHNITGTGKEHRITKEDVLHYLDSTAKSPSAPAPAPVVQPAMAAPKIEQDTTLKSVNLRPEQRVPMTRLRAKVAERLLQAQQNAAMLTTFNEVNMQSVMELRNQYKDRFEQQHKIKLGFMSFFVKASVEALKRFPAINASIDGNDIIYHGYYDIGIAVSTSRGLIVPVLRDADQLDFAGIEHSIANYGSKAREGSLSYEDLNGGTFTITNGGIFGSMLSTPILNPPQCAILGMHAIKERAVVEKGEVVVRPIMYLALSYDHRLVDGKEAVQFLVTIKECLEAPAHLLLNI